MKFLKRISILLVLLTILLMFSACDNSKSIPSPIPSPLPSKDSPTLPDSQTPVPESPSPSPSPSPRPSWTPIPSPTPEPEIIPKRPSEYTDASYFTFDETSGTITGYDIEGGTYVYIPSSINGHDVKILGSKSFAGLELYGVIIPDTVEEIRESAFTISDLKIVEIPNSVKDIGDRAFYLNRLEEIILPSNLVHLGDSAFAYNELKEIVLPETLKEINERAFSFNNLSSIYIPDSIKVIRSLAFYVNKLEKVRLPEGIKKISYKSFAVNQLTSIEIPESVEEIERSAFEENKISDLTIPKNVKTIGSSAFVNNMISELYLPDNLVTLGSFAFGHNLISKLHIGKGLSHIPSSCFSSNMIEDIVIPDNIKSIGRSAFDSNKPTSLSLGKNVESISDYAFTGGQYSELFIPSSVNTIDKSAFLNTPLKSITFEDDILFIADDAFEYGNILEITCLKDSYPEYFFGNKLPNVTITSIDSPLQSFSILREEILRENLTFNHKVEFTKEDFNFFESRIRAYIITKYGPSCKVTSIDTKTNDLIQDDVLYQEGFVYVPSYHVSYEYIDGEETIKKDADIHAIFISSDNSAYILSGIEEKDLDFNDKYILYDYLKKDTRFTFSELPNVNEGIIATGDISICQEFIESEKIDALPITFLIDTVEYTVFETEHSIYIQNIESKYTEPLLMMDYWVLNGFKLLGKVDTYSFAYTKFGHGGYDGVYIYNLLDKSKTEVKYKDKIFYMDPIFTGDDYLIVAHGDDHYSKFHALYKLDYSQLETGKLTKLSDDYIYNREFAFSPDNRYMVYLASKIEHEASNISYKNRYRISDGFECYVKHIKVLDLATMEVVKSGWIFESGSPYYPNTETYFQYEYTSFSINESSIYIKYKDMCFTIDLP